MPVQDKCLSELQITDYTHVYSTTSRVLILEDDIDQIILMKYYLKRSGHEALLARNIDEAWQQLNNHDVDLIVADLNLGAENGFDFLCEVSEKFPRIPLIIASAKQDFEILQSALELNVKKYLHKPLGEGEFQHTIDSVLNDSTPKGLRILAIGAHPDDIEIGCGGSLLEAKKSGAKIAMLVLSRGGVGGDASLREHELNDAAAALGACLYHADFEDTRFDSDPRLIPTIESVVRDFQPDVIMTHSRHDTHQDHRATFEASRVAARSVQTLMSYQSPSSTTDFKPTTFTNVTSVIQAKIELIAHYQSQVAVRSYLSDEMLLSTACYWGRFSKARYAEPFELLRGHFHSKSDETRVSHSLRYADIDSADSSAAA